ncbi:MAG: hypothetical protein ACHP7A_04495 [Caulobacterales bacterium]|jgi:hypothetical protein
MIWLRIVLALLLLLQAASSGFPLLGFTAYRLGLIHPTSGAAAQMVPLWSATPAWQLVVWSVALLMLLAAAVRLAFGRRALALYAAAIAISTGLTQLMQLGPAYRQVFGPVTPPFDYYRLAILVLVGALIWWVEQQRPALRRRGTPLADGGSRPNGREPSS